MSVSANPVITVNPQQEAGSYSNYPTKRMHSNNFYNTLFTNLPSRSSGMHYIDVILICHAYLNVLVDWQQIDQKIKITAAYCVVYRRYLNRLANYKESIRQHTN